ncbi:MAG: DUF429 domain-containing protein [Ramlibacter sp.]|nr:DUF429 domain-containing protein [Ramlibacter sp.]
MTFLIGLDPGGVNKFGWCVAVNSEHLPLKVMGTGLADDASSAVSDALAALPVGAKISGAGIDAPLFWSRSGPRHSDTSVREAIKTAGAPYASGTVQDVNSLRGACLVQGMLAALALREKYPTMPITEAHPKALRWLLPEAKEVNGASEDQRDALLAAVTAWAMARRAESWIDLLEGEANPYSPIRAPLHYFMPGMPRR